MLNLTAHTTGLALTRCLWLLLLTNLFHKSKRIHRNFGGIMRCPDLRKKVLTPIVCGSLLADLGLALFFKDARFLALLDRCQLRRNEKDYANFYSNALHESLLSKDCQTFWRYWQSKFDRKAKRLTSANTTDCSVLVGKFANYFTSLVQPTSVERARDLESEFSSKFCSYVGNACDPSDDLINVELVDDAVGKLKLGKAHDLDSLSAEHWNVILLLSAS
jgi:hypothetical protein